MCYYEKYNMPQKDTSERFGKNKPKVNNKHKNKSHVYTAKHSRFVTKVCEDSVKKGIVMNTNARTVARTSGQSKTVAV